MQIFLYLFVLGGLGVAVIITVNTIHAIANRLLDVFVEKEYEKLKPHHYRERLKTHVHKIN